MSQSYSGLCVISVSRENVRCMYNCSVIDVPIAYPLF